MLKRLRQYQENLLNSQIVLEWDFVKAGSQIKWVEYSDIDSSSCLIRDVEKCDEGLITNIHKLKNLGNVAVSSFDIGPWEDIFNKKYFEIICKKLKKSLIWLIPKLISRGSRTNINTNEIINFLVMSNA